MTTYFVSPTGNDGAAGTSTGAPWQTIAKVNATTFSPGDSISFQGGQSFAGALVFTAGGTPASPITINSYGSGKATLLTPHDTYGIFLHAVGGFNIQNLIIQGPNIDPPTPDVITAGIYAYNDINSVNTLHYLHIDNVEIFNFKKVGAGVAGHGWGIFVRGTPINDARWDDVRITNCLIHDCEGTGIEVSNYWAGENGVRGGNFTNVYIGNCTVHDLPHGFGILVVAVNGAIVNGSVAGGLIEFCQAYNTGVAVTDVNGPVGIMLQTCNAVTIQFCESHHNGTANNDGEGFDFDQGVVNCTIQYCYAHDNYRAGFFCFQFNGANDQATQGNVFRYNVSENDCRVHDDHGAIQIAGGQGLDVYGNTVYISKTGSLVPKGISLDTGFGPTNNIRAFNNLVIIDGAGGYAVWNNGNAPLTLAGNDYWHQNDGGTTFRARWGGSVYTTLASFRTGSGQELIAGSPVGLNVSPGLVSPGSGGTIGSTTQPWALPGYKLAAGSAMAGQGLDLNARFSIVTGGRDFYGATFADNAESIGAAAGAGGGPPAPVIIGNLDNVTTAGLVNGWTGDTANPPVRQTVTITVDGVSVGTVVANQSRPDVHAAIPALDGNQGFTFQIPPGAYFDDGSHSIGALVGGAHISGSPHAFVLAVAVGPAGSFLMLGYCDYDAVVPTMPSGWTPRGDLSLNQVADRFDGVAGQTYHFQPQFTGTQNWMSELLIFQSAATVPDTTAPTIPTGLAHDTPVPTASVHLTWAAAFDAVGVVAYDVARNGVIVGSSTTTDFTDSGLQQNTTYTYTVRARDAAANASAFSSGHAVTTGTIPVGVGLPPRFMRGFGTVRGAGTSDAIQTPNLGHGAQRTITCWFRRDGSGLRCYFTKSSAAIQSLTERLLAPGDGTLHFHRQWSSEMGDWSVPEPAAGLRHFIVIRMDTSSPDKVPTIKIDNVQQTVTTVFQPTTGTPVQNTPGFMLGNFPGGGGNMGGDLARFAVYNFITTDLQDVALFGANDPMGIGAGPVQYLPLGGASNEPDAVTAAPSVVTGTLEQDYNPSSVVYSAGRVMVGWVR